MSEITNNQTEDLNPILKGTVVKCEFVSQIIAPSNLKRIFYHSIETDTAQVFTIGCEYKNPKKLQAGSEIQYFLYGNGKGKLISSNQTEESFVRKIDYTKEAQCILGNDENEASEFVDFFNKTNFKTA